jgi:hypothetical protein
MGENDRQMIERFLRGMVNPELRVQIDKLPHGTSAKDNGEHRDG